MKTMNIQNAFQLAKNKKRKCDTQIVTSEAKTRKTNDKNLDVHSKAGEETTKLSDSKTGENNCSVLSEQIKNNEDNKCSKVITVDTDTDHEKNHLNTSGEDSIIVLSSGNEQFSSELGSSMNKSMESANMTIEDISTSKVDAEAKPVSNTLIESLQKKQRRMSPEEAKRRTELRAEKEKLREQKRQEALAKKQEEKTKREKEKMQAKLEKQQKKEEEDREKERIKQEKKFQEEKEKQEKLQEILKLKNMVQEAKAEVKKQKEQLKIKALEDKLKALEEKKKLEEEKMKLELEKEKKKAKTKQAFESFFLKSGTSSGLASSPQVQQGKERTFLPFQVSDDMVLAPIIPIVAKKRFDKEQLDFHINNQGSDVLYLDALKSKDHKCVRYRKERKDTKPVIDCEVIGAEAEPVQLDLKPKLLQFDENIRPPYWGTFRKKSKIISGRKPFAGEEIFDYDVDSDEEWDEGGPGESLNGTEDDESEDDYEVDNEFFVPHGYLSAEEEGEDVEEGDETPEDQEAHEARLKMKEKEFLSERNRKTTQLKPIILGVFFIKKTMEENDLLRAFQPFEAEDVRTIVKLPISDGFTCTPNSGESNLTRTPSNVKRAVPEEALPFLLRLLHANTNGRQKVIKEFQNFWMQHCSKTEENALDPDSKENKDLIPDVSGATTPDARLTPNVRQLKISKRQLDMSISTVAVWGKPANQAFKKQCWWVKDEFLNKYELTDLPIPNQWAYTLSKEVEDTVSDQLPIHLNPDPVQ